MSARAISARAPAVMLACVLLAVSFAVSECVTVHRHGKGPEIQPNSIVELPPLFISCNHTDIITISAPTKYYGSLYYLYNPNNDVTQLNITSPIKLPHEETSINVEDNSNDNNSLIENTTYKVNNVNLGQKIDSKTKDVFGEKHNEFVIGPVGQEDHGNWVLSVYCKNNGSWMEMFQVITVQIVEQVPIQPASPVQTEGDTFELSFAYPLKDLQTCELILPTVNRPFDRYYRKYERTSLSTCTYVLRNLTTEDAGTWTIVGVGNIVYEGRTSLTVMERTASTSSMDGEFQNDSYLLQTPPL